MSSAQTALVSVILPTRNRSDVLKRAVFSVLAQTYRNLELIVVNDGSTDDTPFILNAIDDSRLRVINREISTGAAAARNAGILASHGQFVAFQDDDDCWLVQKLEKQVCALQEAPPDVGWCLGSYIALERNCIQYVGGRELWDELDYSRGSAPGGPNFALIATPNWLVRRGVLDRSGLFDERLRSWDDWELGLRLERITRRTHLDEPLYIKDNSGLIGLMKMERARASDLQIIMNKHGDMWAGNREVLARYYYYIGRIESRYDPRPAGRRELWMSVRARPWAIKPWFALLLSYLGSRFDAGVTRISRRIRMLIPQ